MSGWQQHRNPWAEKLSQVSLPDGGESWKAMEALLDREMPAGRRWDRRWLLLIMGLLLLIGVCNCPGRKWFFGGKTETFRTVPAGGKGEAGPSAGGVVPGGEERAGGVRPGAGDSVRRKVDGGAGTGESVSGKVGRSGGTGGSVRGGGATRTPGRDETGRAQRESGKPKALRGEVDGGGGNGDSVSRNSAGVPAIKTAGKPHGGAVGKPIGPGMEKPVGGGMEKRVGGTVGKAGERRTDKGGRRTRDSVETNGVTAGVTPGTGTGKTGTSQPAGNADSTTEKTTAKIPANDPATNQVKNPAKDQVKNPAKGPVKNPAKAPPASVRNEGKKEDSSNKERHDGFMVGIGLNQFFTVGSQQPSSYNSGGITGTLGDYIPVPMVRYYFNPKLYVQLEAQINTPQYTRKNLVAQSTPVDSIGTTTGGGAITLQQTVSINKLFYFNVPLSVHYTVFDRLDLGAGLQYSRLTNGVGVFNQNYSAGGVDSFATATKSFKGDSIYKEIKTQEFRFLVDANYTWKRFILGVRYNQALSKFIHVEISPGQITQARNSSLQLYLRYILWDGRKKKALLPAK
jgi:hypothetical protein